MKKTKITKITKITITLFAFIISNIFLVNNSFAVSSQKPSRKVIFSTDTSPVENKLKNIRHKTVKHLKNMNSTVVIMNDDDMREANQDSTIKIYDDCMIKIRREKAIKPIKLQQTIPWGVKEIQADFVWKKYTGKNIKVAVIDSGIQMNHPDLKQNLRGWYNTINPNVCPEDDYGHGTHISGIICAKNNKIGVVGVAPDVDLYSVKVLDHLGEGYVSDLAEGIEWCIRNKIRIINLSFGIQEDTPLLHDTIKKAQNAGIIIVAAAGNTYGGAVDYPAAYDGVISISAIDKTEKIANFAAIGKVDFCAPGVDIYSTYLNSSYDFFEGTSMATPFVSGAIALLLQKNTNYSQKDIIEMLKKSSKDLGKRGKDDMYGYGVIKLKSIF